MKNRPLYIILGFNLLTIFMFVYGPINWGIDNLEMTSIYVLINLLFFYLGGRFFVFKSDENQVIESKTISHFIIFIALAIELYVVSNRAMVTPFRIDLFFSKVAEGLFNPADGYREKVRSIEEGVAGISNYIGLIISPVTLYFQVYFLLNFNHQSIFKKAFILFFYTLEISSWIAVGTNKGIVDMFLLWLVSRLITLENKKIKLGYLFRLMSLGVIVIFVFVNSMISRIGASENLELLERFSENLGKFEIKTSGVYGKLDAVTRFGLTQITSYLSQGYHQLSLALKEPPTFSYGLGSSWIQISIGKKILGDDFFDLTYIGILEKKYGISSTVSWHSMYTWLASDISFWGVPIVFFFIGMFFNNTWKSSLATRRVSTICLFFLFFQMAFYFFANNQVFSFSIIPFLIYFTWWIIGKKISVSV